MSWITIKDQKHGGCSMIMAVQRSRMFKDQVYVYCKKIKDDQRSRMTKDQG